MFIYLKILSSCTFWGLVNNIVDKFDDFTAICSETRRAVLCTGTNRCVLVLIVTFTATKRTLALTSMFDWNRILQIQI